MSYLTAICSRLLPGHTVTSLLMSLLYAQKPPCNKFVKSLNLSILTKIPSTRRYLIPLVSRWKISDSLSALPSLGTIAVVWKKSSRSCKRQCSIPSTTQKNLSNMVCRHRRVYCSMVLLVLVRPCSPRPSQMNVMPISSASRYVACTCQVLLDSYWLNSSRALSSSQCGSVNWKPTSVMSLTKLALLRLVLCSSMSWTLRKSSWRRWR